MAVKGARRMLYAKISVSQDVNSLSIEERLLFTWLIAHGDDEGRLEGDPLYIRNKVVPYTNWSPKKIGKYLHNIKNRGLIHYWQVDNRWVIEFVKWELHQSLRKDRIEHSQLPSFAPNSDNQMATIRQPIDSQMPAERNISESNLKEVKKSEYKEDVAVNNSSFKKVSDIPNPGAILDPIRYQPKNAEEVAAKEVWFKLELNNKLAFHTTYLNAARKGEPASVIYQFCSEIRQDKSIDNPGKVFQKKVNDYLERKGLQR